MKTYELKPCPFCGSNMAFVQNSVEDKQTEGVHFEAPVAVVTCGYCCATVGFFKIKEDVSVEEAEAKAVEYWNMRADDEEDYEVLE